MALQFVTKRCSCGKQFKTSNDSRLCYDCTLEEICAGTSPEEGDFNTAKIRSGTMTEQECAYLQQDLESVENGTSSFELDDKDTEYLDIEDDEERENEDEDDYSAAVRSGCNMYLNPNGEWVDLRE